MNKREALKLMTTGAMAMSLPAISKNKPKNRLYQSSDLKGNINHSACRWCYSGIELEDLCGAARDLGLSGIDLLNPSEWQTAFDADLTVTMATPDGFSIPNGFNDPANHDELFKTYSKVIDQVADAGLKNLICFSGNRDGLDDASGLENCATGLDKLVKQAEKRGVVLIMELLNSKVDHADYQCDRTPWGVDLCEKIGSDSFKLLYDIYHMQIMEGDVIRTIQDFNQYIGHYHTGGVPGRNEINETQELYYPAIMNAIVETGYEGFVAQEFIPKAENPLESLAEAIEICDV